MKRLKVITKYFTRNALEEMFASGKMKPGVIILLMMLVIGFISLPFGALVGLGYNAFHSMGQEGYLLALILFVGATVTFLFGIFTIMNVFYYSNDIEQMLPLPFKSSEIVFGKFISVLINMYIYSAIIVLPLVVYGVVSKANIIYYLYAFIALVITPILPMILASLICMVLMRFTGLSKHKDAFKMATGCLALVLVVVFNVYTQSGNSGNPEAIMETIAKGNNSLMNMLTSIFITNKFSAYGLLYNKEIKGLLFILLSLGVSIAIFTAYYFIGGKLYLKGVIGISEGYGKRENVLGGEKAGKLTKTSSPLKALVIKDIRVVLRTPQFFINCIAMLFYIPAIMCVGIFRGDQLSKFAEFLSGTTEWYGMAIVISFVIATLSIAGGGAGLTALSREGRDFMISKYIPIDFKTQMHSKIISSLCINEFAAIMVVVGLLLVKASPILLILGTVSAIGAIVLITLICIVIDFNSPKLEWEDEKAMYKGNFMPLLITIIIMILGLIIAGISFIVKSYIIVFIIIMLIVAGGSFIMYKKLVELADRVYNEN
ncbi:putative ABC transporter permease subunit [Clostridium sp. LP20]|uniref:putative ABC transporter permease subunit n=1 Tax=Clostridium sp. LP20 TaxID=3418665 RepID=UPI003EE51A4C